MLLLQISHCNSPSPLDTSVLHFPRSERPAPGFLQVCALLRSLAREEPERYPAWPSIEQGLEAKRELERSCAYYESLQLPSPSQPVDDVKVRSFPDLLRVISSMLLSMRLANNRPTYSKVLYSTEVEQIDRVCRTLYPR